MKTYNWHFALFLIIMLILTGCTKSTFPTVEHTFISPYIPNLNLFAALTPDGNYLTLSDFSQIALKNGEENYPFDDYISQEWQSSHAIKGLKWSSDGQYLAITTSILTSNPAILNPVYVIDTKNYSISSELNIAPFLSWSPFNNEYILANLPDSKGIKQSVYSVKNWTPISSKVTNSENNVNFGGAGYFLWSRQLNLPIARIDWRDPINFAGGTETQEVGLVTFMSKNGEIEWDYSTHIKKYTSSPPDNAINAIFDPSGKYILILQWKCSANGTHQCSLYPDKKYFNNIIDTALILVDWQTGEQKELIRLSKIDPINFVGLNTEWSSDGSTVLVWRKDASPIVLKIKYPRSK